MIKTIMIIILFASVPTTLFSLIWALRLIFDAAPLWLVIVIGVSWMVSAAAISVTLGEDR